MMRKLDVLLVVLHVLTTACSKPTEKADGDKPTIKIGYLPITHAGHFTWMHYLQEDLKTTQLKW